jgi:fused signal recognition particle receptor
MSLTIILVIIAAVVAAIAALAVVWKKPEQLTTKPTPEALPPGTTAGPGTSDGKKSPPSIQPIKADGGETGAASARRPLPSGPGSSPGSEARVDTTPAPPRDVAGLRKGLAATRGGFVARLSALFGLGDAKKEIDPNLLSQLEEVMLTSDVGVRTTQAILERLRERLAKNELADADAVWNALRAEATRILTCSDRPLRLGDKPSIVLVVGVNGVGKTTTIGKLATRFVGQGKTVMLAAGDTFRAAAVAQLEVWGKRVGADVVKGKEGADPGAVAFEATTRSKEARADLLFVDTAGRLHTKAPLMDEVKKVRRTIDKALPGAPHETLLVLDATTGQNALQQATLFKEALDLTGIVLTKLDGTAKGGIVLAVCDELRLPVRFIGLGERAEDLREFHVDEFVEALFGDRATTQSPDAA